MTEQPKVDRYKILGKLGSGGMGVVYRAEDTTLQRSVALKFLPADLSAREDLRIRFLREARTVAALNHPNICTIHEVREVEPGASLSLAPGDPPLPPGTPYLAMELIEGRTLQQVLSSHEPLPLKSLLDIAGQVAEGLAEAHQRHIVHRDLKPGNIMVTPQGRVKILDFGLAKALQPAQPRDDLLTAAQTLSEERTREGKVVGTIAYMSPEQARGQPLDARSDTFSFGIVLYEMASGKSPFAGSTPMDTLSAIIQKQERPIRELNPEVPPKLADVVGKCLAKDPGERYQDSRDIVVDLKYLSRELASGASSPSAIAALPAPLWRRPAAWAAAVALGILLIVGAVLVRGRAGGGGAGGAEPSSNSLAVLAFENLKDPGDPDRLGQILQELIITDLSGHDSVKVFSSQRLYDVCKQITGKEPKTLDRAIATQVASRAGAATMLTGTLSQLGPQWILTGQLVDVSKGTVLKSARIDGTDLYAMVDQLTAQIRRDFHVPVAAGAVPEIPVVEKTASSMEAYRHYLAGQDLLNSAKYKQAGEEFEKAISIDPTFSQAYYKLAVSRWWGEDDLELAEKPLSDLLSGRLHVPAKEKLMAEGALSLIAHCYQQGQPVFERLAHDNPEEKEAWYGLGEALYHGGGDLSRAREAFDATLKLDPAFTLSWQHILDIALRERKQAEFFTRIKSAIEKDRGNLLLYRYWVQGAIRSSDEKETAAAMGEATARHVSQEERRELFKAAAGAYMGADRADVAKAEDFYRKAQDADPKHEDTDIMVGLGAVAWRRGDYAESEKRFAEILEADPKKTAMLGALGELSQRDRRYQESLARVVRAIHSDPENPALYRAWVNAAIVAGDKAETERAMQEALKRNTEGPALRLLYSSAARAYSGNWNPEKVEDFARKALDAVPGCETSEVVRLLGMSESNLCRYAEAEKWLRKSLDLAGDNFGIYYTVYESYKDQRRYGDFLREAEQWIRSQPGSTVPYYLSAQATVFTGQEDRIDAAVAAALAHRADPVEKKELYTAIAWSYLDLTDLKRGEAFARKAIDAAPETVGAWTYSGLGWALLRLKNDREAEGWLVKALRDQPYEENVLRGLSEIHLARKEYPKALEYVQKMASSSPSSPWGRIGIHEVLVRSGRLAEAERALDAGFAALPSPTARRLLLVQAGWTCIRNGRLENARSAFDRARLLDPEGRDPDVHGSIGWLLLLQGKREEAERAFRAGIEAMPRHDGNLRGLSTVALLGKKDADAEKIARDVLTQGPANVSMHRLLASILADEGKFAEAEKSARQAVSMDASRESLDLLAWILVAGDLDVDGGVASARQALKAPPNYWDSWESFSFTPVAEHTLGLAALKKGAAREAVKLLEEAARLRPDRASIREDLQKASAGVR